MIMPGELQDLIKRADLAHEAGDINQEIEYRLRAFVLSEGFSPRPVEEIEKAAHLICDIGDGLDDPSSDEQWLQATRHAESRYGLVEGAIIELVKAEYPERAFAITQRIKSPSLIRRLRQHTMSREELSPIASKYRDTLLKKFEIQQKVRQASREGEPEDRLHELRVKSDEIQKDLKSIEANLRKEDPEALAGFGAPLEPDDLLPLFPPDGSSCLVDLFLTGKEGIVLLAFRKGEHIEMIGMIAAAFDRQLFIDEAERWFRSVYSGQPIGNCFSKILLSVTRPVSRWQLPQH